MRLKITDYSSNRDLADAIRRYHVLLQMTFESNIYKVFETTDSQIYRFLSMPAPAPQQTGISVPVEIYATDDYWNRTAVDDAVTVTSDDPKATTPVVGPLVNGYGPLDVTFGSAGTWTLTVAHNSNPAIAGMTSDGIMVFSSVPDFVIERVPGPVTAGEPVPVTIRVVPACMFLS